MTRELSEIISDMRNIVKPYIAKQLKQLNFENCGSTDKAEFETEFEMVLTLAEMANNQVTPQEPKPRKGEWLRMSDLSEEEDDRYRCSHCGNVVRYNDKMNLYTFNSWCGRCGSDNGRQE